MEEETQSIIDGMDIDNQALANLDDIQINQFLEVEINEIVANENNDQLGKNPFILLAFQNFVSNIFVCFPENVNDMNTQLPRKSDRIRNSIDRYTAQQNTHGKIQRLDPFEKPAETITGEKNRDKKQKS